MIKELRIYWRLRPFVAQLKEVFKMRFSLNVVIQVLSIIAQALNQILSLVPEKNKMQVAAGIGVIQAVTAFLAHFRNPDGTPAAEEYAPKRNGKVLPLLVIGLLLAGIFSIPAIAAEPETLGGVGMSWNQYTTSTPVNGNMLLAKRVGEGIYSFNFVDIVSKSIKPFSVATSITTGIGKQVTQVYGVPLYVTTGVGVLTGDTNTGYSWQSGGAAVISLKKGWYLLPNVRVIKSSLTDFQWIGGLMIGLGK